MLTYCKRLRTQDNQWQLSFHSNSGKASLRIHSCTAASPALGGFVQKCMASALRDDFPFFHIFFQAGGATARDALTAVEESLQGPQSRRWERMEFFGIYCNK